MFRLHVYMYTACVPGAHRGQNRGIGSHGTGLMDGVSHYVDDVDAGNQAWVH